MFDKVATTKHLSPQLWKMWRQREYGWTPLKLKSMFTFFVTFGMTIEKILTCIFTAFSDGDIND
jgi:hypothetical protein